MALPEGTVAFLLTDVEGSTRLWERAPEVMPAVIARHYELLDDAIAAHGGQRPQEQGEGDSVVAVFTDAAGALRAAVDAQRALAVEPWADALDVRVRMAIHVGQTVKRNAMNYVGSTIIRCARLRACAYGGQIVVSDAAAALIRSSLPDGVSLVSLGSHRLKDLDVAEHVYQVAAPGLVRSFPPLRSLAAGRHNLPLQATPLIGRDHDVAAVVALLPRTRVVTLTGSGGVGKTRLALQVAAEAADEFAGGVWWVDLATISDGDSVAASVLAAVGGSQQPMTLALNQLVTVLEPETSLMVVLDNCEHVADGCAAVVDAVLARCHGVAFVATSREPLGVAGEVTWRVASLALPTETPSLDDIDRYSALALFWERAWRARPQLVVTDSLVEASVRICRRVDGIPLAIELAAARCRQLSPERIANELDEHYRLLAGGGRTQLARQRTLEASVDWSHRLLADDERTAFRRLAVFTGWFPLAAAEGVVSAFGDIDAWSLLDLVSRLADKSLLVVDDETDPREPRYRMLETIRFFALEQARDAGELGALRDAHAAWSAAWIDGLDAVFLLTHHMPALESWYPNLRDAMRWVAADADRSIPFLRGLAQYAANFDHLDDCRFMVGLSAELYRTKHPQWFLIAGRVACAAVMVGAIDFVVGPVTEALEVAIANDDHECAALCLLGLGFLDPTGAAFADGARHASAAGRVDLSILEGVGSLSVDCESLPIIAAELARIRLESPALDPVNLVPLEHANGQVYVAQGSLAEARFLCRQVAENHDLTRAVAPPVEYMLLALSACVDVLQGEAADLERVLIRQADRRFRGIPNYWSGVWVAAIDVAAHHAYGKELDVSLVESAIVEQLTDTGSASMRLLVGELLDRGRVDAVRTVLTRFRSVAYTEASFRRLVHDWFEAHLLAAEGNIDDGERHLREILPRLLAQEARPMIIDSLELLAVLMSASPSRAVRILRATQAERDAIGYRFRFPNHQGRVDDALASCEAGDDPPMALGDAVAFALRATGRRGRPAIGWPSLTPTEREVSRLVADGATNPVIAKTLAMTVNTVKTHLSHVFTKLEITSRAQLARVVTEKGNAEK
jgi:predicted ATPase/class 3 adenylate cyclase/DNA-binding CsgD family transcriptional regulator